MVTHPNEDETPTLHIIDDKFLHLLPFLVRQSRQLPFLITARLLLFLGYDMSELYRRA